MIKDTIKKLTRSFVYLLYLLVGLIGMFVLSAANFELADGNLFAVYIGNILIISWVLFEEKLWDVVYEKLHQKLKKDGFIKRQVKKSLAQKVYKPSVKSILYTYYLLCIAIEHLLKLDVTETIMPFTVSSEYLSTMYYSFVFLLALDKVKENMGKEGKYRKKYYAKFSEE